MNIEQAINSIIEINKLKDLVKLNALIEKSNSKVNLSEIDKELAYNRMTKKIHKRL